MTAAVLLVYFIMKYLISVCKQVTCSHLAAKLMATVNNTGQTGGATPGNKHEYFLKPIFKEEIRAGLIIIQ